MPMASGTYVLGLLALMAILVAGMVVTTTVSTGAGTALAVLLVLVAAADVAGTIWNAPLVAAPAVYLASHPFAGIGTAFTETVDEGFFCVASVAALVVAAITRHWRWLAGILAAVLPMVALGRFRVCCVAAPHSAACQLVRSGRRNTAFNEFDRVNGTCPVSKPAQRRPHVCCRRPLSVPSTLTIVPPA